MMKRMFGRSAAVDGVAVSRHSAKSARIAVKQEIEEFRVREFMVKEKDRIAENRSREKGCGNRTYTKRMSFPVEWILQKRAGHGATRMCFPSWPLLSNHGLALH